MSDVETPYVIEKFKEYEDVHNKAERLQDLIKQAENAEKGLNGKKLFNGKDYNQKIQYLRYMRNLPVAKC